MIPRLMTFLAILMTAASIQAQEDRPQQPPDEGNGLRQVNRDEMRTGQLQRQLRFIRRQLDLDERQQEQFDQLAEKFKKDSAGSDVSTRRQELFREMREASKQGNQERVKEIQEELNKVRRGSELDPFLNELEKILREDQIEKLTELRSQMESRRNPPRGPLAQLERLRDELKLNDDQAAQYDALYDELKQKVGPGGEGDNSALVQELMQAAQEENQEKIKELREKISASSRDQEKYITEFMENVESFLEPEQKRTLDEYRSRMRSRRGGLELRDCFQYASRLELDAQQREGLRELQRESRKAESEARRDPDASQKLTEDYIKKIRDLLNDEQCAQFDRWVDEQKAKERGDRGDRRGGRDRGERRRPRPQPPEEEESETP